ncbi:MAG: glycosyltransferase family 1 protein, partial [Clostridia bacterium]|nr:glycosyltransferase family 1 protein [Clostridia bacterium]
MKILFTASIEKHFLAFHIPYLKFFHDAGYEVHTAAKGEEMPPYVDVKHEVAFERSPFSTKNFAAYRELK